MPMRINVACEAIEKGCCLELDYGDYCVVVEPHAVGTDHNGRAAVLGWERTDSSNGHPGEWRFLDLDRPRSVSVSGYLSEAPRPDFRRDSARFAKLCCQA